MLSSAQAQAAGATPEKPLFFMCRSGGRSLDAMNAMMARGYMDCHNIADGFEGDPDGQSQRGRSSGWKASSLAWKQG